jgi:hypothetical protein
VRYAVPVKRICTVAVDKSTLPGGADPWPMPVEGSVFEAAAVIIQQFSVTWWANRVKVIEVRSGEGV